MDWPTAAVSIAGTVATGTVAVWALVGNHKHDLRVRRQERRSSAYLELMTALHRVEMRIERTAPSFVVGKPPPPPPELTDEESWRLNALADVVASDEVRALIEAWTRKTNEFYNAVWYLGQVQRDEEGRPPSEVRDEYGVTGREQWDKVARIREEIRGDLRGIGERIRAEL